MQEDRANYGRPREPVEEPDARIPSPEEGYRTKETLMPGAGTALSTQDEKSWSVLAHLSILLNVVTGLGGLLAAPVIWLVYRERSPRVAFHALQSFWYQAAWAVGLTVGWSVTVMLMVVLVGFFIAPFMALLTLVPFVQSIYAAHKINQGVEYRYPLIANMIDGGPEK